MSYVQKQSALRPTVPGRKANTSTFSNPSLVSPTTPTLANPTRSFGLPTNNALIQTQTEPLTNLQEAQSADQQSLEPQTTKQKFFGHDISRISLRRPQAKLTVGAPNDQYEQEADRVADQVINMPNSAMREPIQREAIEEEEELQMKPLAATISPLVQRQVIQEGSISVASQTIQRDMAEDFDASDADQAEEETEEQAPPGYLEFLQMKPSLQREATEVVTNSSQDLETQLISNQGKGSSLPDETRSFMESRFGSDFTQVRVHTDSNAIQMNQELGAQAFTHKQDIYFGSGKYDPMSSNGKRLLAHELTHVVQQTGKINTKPSVNQLTKDRVQKAERTNQQIQLKANSDNIQAIQCRLEEFVYGQYADFLNTKPQVAQVNGIVGGLVQAKCETCEAEENVLLNRQVSQPQMILREQTQQLVALSNPSASVQLSPSCWAEKLNLVAAIAALLSITATTIAAILAPEPTTLTKWAALGLILGIIGSIAWVINGIIALIACLESDPNANQREIEQLRRRQEQLERTMEQLRQLQGQQPAPAPTPTP